MERERQNSIESIHDSDESALSSNSSSPTGSAMASSEDDNEEDTDEDLVTLLKQKNWGQISIMTSSQRPRVKSLPRWQLGSVQPLPQQQHQPPHLRSRTALRNNASSSYRLREIDVVRGQKLALCSIPEDVQTSRMLLFCPDDEEEDEPIYHRSPVTLDNGYRPRRQINSNGDLEEGEVDGLDESDDSNTDFEEEEEEGEEATGRKISLWRLLAIMIYLLRCLMIALFVAVVFVVFVLLTHDPPPLKSQTGYFLFSFLFQLLLLDT